MPAPLISIVLPVRNGAATLDQALDSCRRQTLTGWELIAVNDASSDSTGEQLAAWARRDARVRAIHASTPLGVAAAFQLGLQEAQAPEIARMDADDINHPNRLKAQHTFLSAHPDVDAVSCLVEIRSRAAGGKLNEPEGGYRRFADWLNSLTTPEAIEAQRFIDQPVVNPTMLIQRRVFDRHRGYRGGLEWAEDYDLWLRVLHAGGRLAKIPEHLFTWTDHPDRLTRTHADYTQEAFIRCKAHYLAQISKVRESGVSLLGAGPIGKRLAKALTSEGVTVRQFIEVHPRRIGERIHGAPVVSSDTWQETPSDGTVVLGAVGQPGRRQHLLALAQDHGLTEGQDYFAVA